MQECIILNDLQCGSTAVHLKEAVKALALPKPFEHEALEKVREKIIIYIICKHFVYLFPKNISHLGICEDNKPKACTT